MALSTDTVEWATNVNPLPLALDSGLPVRAIWFRTIPANTSFSFADHATGDVFYVLDSIGAERVDVPLLGATGNPILQVDVTASPPLSSPLWVAYTNNPWAPFKQGILNGNPPAAGTVTIETGGSIGGSGTSVFLAENGAVVLIQGPSAGINTADSSTITVDASSHLTMSGTSTTLETNGASSFLENGSSTAVIAGGMSFLIDLGAQCLFTNGADVQLCTGQDGGGPSITLGGNASTRFTVDGGAVNMDKSWDLLAIGNTSGIGILIVHGTLNLAQPGTNTNAGLLYVAGVNLDGNATLTIEAGARLDIYTSIASGAFECSFRLVGNLDISGVHIVLQDVEVVSLTGAVMANWTSTQPSGHTVDFTDASYDDNSFGHVNAWSWDFGDSNSSTSQNPAHTYASAGTYTVVLTATTSGGHSSTATKHLVVT